MCTGIGSYEESSIQIQDGRAAGIWKWRAAGPRLE